MPNLADFRQRIQDTLGLETFCNLTTDELRNFLGRVILLPAREQEPLDREICAKLRTVSDPKVATLSVLSAPRPSWVKVVIDLHGLQAFADLHITESWPVDFPVLLDPRHIDNAALRTIYSWLSPVLRTRASVVSSAASVARDAKDGDRLMAVLEGSGITSAEIFDALHHLKPWNADISHVLEVGTRAFDDTHHPRHHGLAQKGRVWKISDCIHLVAAALARHDTLPAGFSPTGSDDPSDEWASPLARIATSRHHQIKLAAGLQGLGGTQEIFSLRRGDLISCFEEHAPSRK